MLKKKGLYSLLQYIALLDMKRRDYKVLLYILNRINNEDFVKINQKTISEELNLSKSEVSKAMKKLMQEKLIIVNEESANTRKKVEVKLNDFSKDELDDLIFDIIEKNTIEDI